MPLPAAELHALSRKYALLGELRRRRDALPPPELGPLSREFPGALRELDALPLDELDRRSRSVELALGGGPTEALLDWISAYHALMRAALSIKRRLRGRHRVEREEALELAASTSRELGVSCDHELVVAVADPPRGRLNELVLGRLSASFGVTPERLRAALFRDAV